MPEKGCGRAGNGGDTWNSITNDRTANRLLIEERFITERSIDDEAYLREEWERRAARAIYAVSNEFLHPDDASK